MVSDYCSCGAHLPPDARFCHKCGKPQYDLPLVVEDEPIAPPLPHVIAPTAPPAPPPIGWRNPLAVRIAFLAGGVASLLLLMPLPPVINLVWMFIVLVAGGFWSVHLYRKRTRTEVSVRGGAHLGWMTGIFAFVVLLVVFTVNVVVITSVGGLREAFQSALHASGPPEVADQYAAMLSSPAGMAGLIVAVLLTTLIMLPLFSTIGGALGAKVLEKE